MGVLFQTDIVQDRGDILNGGTVIADISYTTGDTSKVEKNIIFQIYICKMFVSIYMMCFSEYLRHITLTWCQYYMWVYGKYSVSPY